MAVEAHTGLAHALLAFNAEAPDLHKDKGNPAFRGAKYLSLDALMDTVRPLLTKHGLVWVTMPGRDEFGPVLGYRLIHKDGEEIVGAMPLLLTKQDAQGIGSAITYARRYSLMAVLGLVADEDDDGNGAAAPQRTPAGPPVELATESDIAEIKAAGKGLTNGKLRLAFGAIGLNASTTVLEEIPRAKVPALVAKLGEIER